jgi:SpoVK/Ycf46/Vps4 family AAA+-type ATPase
MGEIFVNREEELRLINSAVTTLQSRQLLQTPIIEFYGVQGIGKTMLLKHIEMQCSEKHLSYVATDLTQGEEAITRSVGDARTLLDMHQPVVMILDSLDATSPTMLQGIEAELRDLIENSFLFVVLASRNEQRFTRTRSLARKLVTRSLQPIGPKWCAQYLKEIEPAIGQDVRDMIFEWTGGYPLAMNVMTDAIIKKQLHPGQEQDQKLLMSIISEKVINQKLFSAVSAPDLSRYQTLFTILSVPRRFNLALMQDLVEAFASQHSLASSIAYISFPGSIAKEVSAISWDLVRSGYCIEAPVRRLFLRKLRIEQPQLYQAIHRFLANKNRDFIQEVVGADRIHYLREYFYHLAHCEPEEVVQQIILEQLEPLIDQGLKQEHVSFAENLVRFHEEFRQDEDLQEALSRGGTDLILSLFLKSFLRIYKHIPAEARNQFLQEIFVPGNSLPQGDDFTLLFEEKM